MYHFGKEFYMDFYTPGWERLNVTLAPHPPNPVEYLLE